jgi:hypothetical protein
MTQAYTIAAIDPGLSGGAVRLDVDGERVVVEAWCAWWPHVLRGERRWRLTDESGSVWPGFARSDVVSEVVSHLTVAWEGLDAWVLEQPMVGRSVSSALALAEECGMWRHELGCAGHEPVRMHPSEWRRVLGIGRGVNTSEAHAARLTAYLVDRVGPLASPHVEAACGMAMAHARVLLGSGGVGAVKAGRGKGERGGGRQKAAKGAGE